MDRSEHRRPTGITVVGTGTVSTPVDRVTINLAVDVTRPDAGEAFRLAGDTVTRLLAVLADDGVDARQVRTLDLSLGPRTQWTDNSEVLIGYQAHQRLVVQLDGLAGVERILSDVATNAGHGVRIDSVSLTAEVIERAFAQAREKAFADAWGKAEHFARLAGKALGEVEWIHEGRDHGGAVPLARMAKDSVAMSSPMPVAAGDTDLTVSVTVRWAFAGD